MQRQNFIYKTGFGINHDGYVYERRNGVLHYPHRENVEKALGRLLLPGEVVHHIDENKLNNNIENLMLFSKNGGHRNTHRHKYIQENYVVFDGRKGSAVKW